MACSKNNSSRSVSESSSFSAVSWATEIRPLALPCREDRGRPPPSSSDDGGDGSLMVEEDKFPVAALQVRSLLEGDGPPKRVRATLRGSTAKRLAAHRRLIAAISEVDGRFLFTGPVGISGEVCSIVSMPGVVATVGDDGGPFEDWGAEPARRRSPPLPTPIPILPLPLPTLPLPTTSLAPGPGTLLPSGMDAEVVVTVTARGDFPLEVGACTESCGAGAGAAPVFPDGGWEAGRALAGNRADLVARRRLGNKVGGRTYSSRVSRRNLSSQQ
jgi:hypothetical protein